jgi:hypothetical protein
MSLACLNRLLVACWIAFASGVSGVVSASPDAPAVLFLEEDEAGRPGYVALMSGFRQALEKRLPGRVAIYQENLDLARFSDPDYRGRCRQWFQDKYRDTEIDVLVASGPLSVKLAGDLREELWPGARIIGVAGDPLAEGAPHVTWLTMKLDAAGTLDAARALVPGASRLVVVVGARSAYAGFNEFILREAEAAAARHGLAMESLAGLSLAETRHRLSLLPRDAIVFYGSISVDGAGRAYTPRDVLEDLARASGAPIFGFSETFMGYGMTGGVVLRMEELGRELADMTGGSSSDSGCRRGSSLTGRKSASNHRPSGKPIAPRSWSVPRSWWRSPP